MRTGSSGFTPNSTFDRTAGSHVVSDQVASWPAKVEAMFSLLEQESGGDYAAALASLKLRNVPPPVKAAYAQALQAPSRAAWAHLKAVFLENPPGN